MAELVPVPTVEELHRDGQAVRLQEPRYSVFQLLPDGQARIYAAMAHNAELQRAVEAVRQAEATARRIAELRDPDPDCWCGHLHPVHTDTRCRLCACAGYSPQDL